jgi:quercetin dioxygenase-like cupin family protein
MIDRYVHAGEIAMKPTLVAVTLLLASLPLSSLAKDQHAIVQPDAIEWGAAPPVLPPGGQLAVISGDPGKPGPFVVRFKAPAGYQIPAHTHPTDENVTVISGSIHIGMGSKLDTGKGEKLPAGGFARLEKGMPHYAWFSEPGVVQIHGIGPVEFTYVDPADDPRTKGAAK